MSLEEFKMREDSIRAEYGKPALKRHRITPIVPPPQPPQPSMRRANSQPFVASTSANGLTLPMPPVRSANIPAILPPHPFGTPIKNEPIDLDDEDGIFNPPPFPQINADELLFNLPPFGFAPPHA
ncbi:hypothetical protein FS749_002364 [Ceratobasidium sp. UAMH 11750]|nr:hypothetical protein FS749_002364 [Ceratobasidium sp. UAMH 11750]